MPVNDENQVKAKAREFDGVIKTNFLGDEIPKENVHYTCIACITKKNYSQVYLEECKYNIKKIKMPKFINTELELESESKSESELESDTILKSDS